MSHEALIAPIVNIEPIPGADNIVQGLASGYRVVVSKTVKEGQIGVIFPPGLQISHDMCFHNNLYRKDRGENKDPTKNGFFETNRRVKAIKLRGVKSEGCWMGLETLEWTGINIFDLKAGDKFQNLDDKEICQKYISAATRSYMEKRARQGKRSLDIPMFKQHFETDQVRSNYQKIPAGSLLIYSCKLHGTSGRTSLSLIPKKLNPLKIFWNKHFSRLHLFEPSDYEWGYVSGTRRVILEPDKGDGYYSGKTFRFAIHDDIQKRGLHKGETLYYEIVGYDETGGLIMPEHKIEDKELEKRFGTKVMRYTYGCEPKQFKTFIYRITLTNEDGDSVELSWPQVKARAKELGMETVPELEVEIYDGNPETILTKCSKHANTIEPLDTHVREGVCLRVEHESMSEIFKWKSFFFAKMEGIKTNEETYIDPEDVA